jgi:hypothetical protein
MNSDRRILGAARPGIVALGQKKLEGIAWRFCRIGLSFLGQQIRSRKE